MWDGRWIPGLKCSPEWEVDNQAPGSAARAAALYISRYYLDQTLRELCQRVEGIDYAAVTIAIRRFKKQLEEDKGPSRCVKCILTILHVKT
jgi:hypothetical protein